jgi:hypothetical protein
MAYGTANVDNIQSSTAGTPVVFKDGNGTQIGTLCRAWVNFNGTGTVAIRASFNVSSITDNGAGDYTVNFTTALSDTNYAVIGTAKYVASAEGQNFRVGTAAYGTTVTTSSVRINITNGGNAAQTDSEMVNVSVFR